MINDVTGEVEGTTGKQKGDMKGCEGGVQADAQISALAVGIGAIIGARESRRAEPHGDLMESLQPETGRNREGGEQLTAE